MKKTLLSFVLVLSLVVSCFSSMSIAQAPKYDHLSSTEETYFSVELGGTFIRQIEDSKTVVTFEPLDNKSDSYTVIVENGKMFINGNAVSYGNPTFLSTEGFKDSIFPRAGIIRWGSWQTFSEKVYTGGLATSLVAGVIGAAAPWLSIRVIAAAVATGASSDYYTISGKIRYGSDDTYDYYERYTSISTDKGSYIMKDNMEKRKKAKN